MGYKIAVVSSDGKNIDLCFGKADEFLIYEVENKEYYFLEKRSGKRTEDRSSSSAGGCGQEGCGAASGSRKEEILLKVGQITDCRSIVCKRMGFQVQRQLERHSVTCFDISGSVDSALERIASYFAKVDSFQSLRGMGKIKGDG